MKLALIKTQAGLTAADPPTEDALRKTKAGDVIHGEFTKARNPGFHRKFFALINLAFDAWEPPELLHNGAPVQKNFDRFRKDLIIAAGYFEAVANLRGEVRAEAMSISFGSMEQAEFEQVYSKVADVILQRILTKYTREDLDRVVEQVMGFL